MSSYLDRAEVTLLPRFHDERGVFSVLYEADEASRLGLPPRFVQDNHSLSYQPHTIRGIHLQLPPHEQGKLVTVLRGRIVDVIVDLRPDSPCHGEHELIELTDDGQQLWVPPGFGHGFCTLEVDTEVLYKVDAPYAPAAERTLAWNDPTLGVDWPADVVEPVLSEKDAAGLSFAAIVAEIAAAAAGAPADRRWATAAAEAG